MANTDINLDSLGDGNDEQPDTAKNDVDDTQNLIRQVIEFCGGPDLIQVFGPTGSGKTEFCIKVAQSAAEDENKDVLFIDTERNLSNNERIENTDYVYVPDFQDLYAFVSGNSNKLSDDPFGENTTGSNSLQDGYDMIVLDSMGFPALMAYDEYSIEDNADQFKVFQMIQYMSGELKKYAQKNNSLVISTNQPKSELSESGGEDPFGDKSLFAFKELWRTKLKNTSEVKTTCIVSAHRSRQSGKGKKLFELIIQDSGTTVNPKYNESVEDKADEWTV